MYFKFGQYELDIDVEKTRKFYETAKTASEGCDCAGCRNYEKAAAYLPREVTGFFESIGAEVTKITEAIAYTAKGGKTVYYGGFYHICGMLLNVSNVRQEDEYKIAENYSVSFWEDILMLEENFPLPALQIEISADIPWVLDEECPY